MFLTHLHADHSGLAAKFKNKYQGKVYCSQIDTNYINTMNKDLYSGRFCPYFKIMGMDNSVEFFKTHPRFSLLYKRTYRNDTVKKNDKILFGRFEFEVIDVSGQSTFSAIR